MQMRTVLIAMGASGLVLLGYTIGLHEHLVAADEPRLRHACKRLCRLAEAASEAGGSGGPVTALARSFEGRRCDALPDDAPELLRCRDRLRRAGMSKATWRCIVRAPGLDAARRCAGGLR